MPAYLVLLRMEVTAFHVHYGEPQLTRLCGPIPRFCHSTFQSSDLWRTAVNRHPALCSPDFPPSLQGDHKGLPQFAMPVNWQAKRDGDCLASFILHSSMSYQPTT